MTKYQQSYKEIKRQRLIREIKIAVAIMSVAIGITFLTYQITMLVIELREVTVEEPKEQQENIIPEPCSLDTVDCEGGYPDLELSISPCQIHYQAERCTYEERRKLEIKGMIREAAEIYGVDVDEALNIAECESQFDERARNPVSSAKGLYQFTDGTWENIKAQGHQYDAEENIKQFMIWYPLHPEWWVCE